MLRKIIFLAVTSGLVARAYKAYVAKRDGLDTRLSIKEPLNVWEDEGGSLKPRSPNL